MRRFLFENSLSLFFGVIFLAALVGQSIAGQRVFNKDERAHGGEPVSWLDYVLSIHRLPPPARVTGVEAGWAPHGETGSSG